MRKLVRLLFMFILVIVALFGMFLVYATVTDFSPDPVIDIEKEGSGILTLSRDTLNLMTWNLGYFGLGREMDFFYDGGRQVRPAESLHNKYRDGILSFLSKQDTVDFLLLQEVDIDSKRSYYNNQWEEIKNISTDKAGFFATNYDVAFVPRPVYQPMGRIDAGMGTLSSFNAELAQRIAFEGNYSWPLRLFMLDRCFIKTVFSLPSGKKLLLINTHNSAFDGGELRQKQLDALKKEMTAYYEAGHYVIIGGDWNLNPRTFYGKLIDPSEESKEIKPKVPRDFLPKGWKWAYEPTTPTNRVLIESYLRGRTPVTLIDFFIISPNVELISVKTEDLYFEYSDHNPVFMKVRLK